jgi:hypothetical protein
VAPKGALLELPAHEAEALLSDGWVKEECRACAAEEHLELGLEIGSRHLELGLDEGVVPSATATTPAAAAAAAAQERGQLGRLGEARVEVGEAADSLLQGAAQARRRCI